MLTTIGPDDVLRTFGLCGITCFPRFATSRMHRESAQFLSSVGLPSNSFFSPKVNLETPSPLECTPSLKLSFEEDEAERPTESEEWEILGDFMYATVAIDPTDGRICAFPEGEVSP
jgi:hypothetical protein